LQESGKTDEKSDSHVERRPYQRWMCLRGFGTFNTLKITIRFTDIT